MSLDRLKCGALIGAFTVTVAAPAVAKVMITFPVSIPMECVELAQREGVPIIITNKYEAAKAKIKLARLSDRDPMVHECREAVARGRNQTSAQSR